MRPTAAYLLISHQITPPEGPSIAGGTRACYHAATGREASDKCRRVRGARPMVEDGRSWPTVGASFGSYSRTTLASLGSGVRQPVANPKHATHLPALPHARNGPLLRWLYL